MNNNFRLNFIAYPFLNLTKFCFVAYLSILMVMSIFFLRKCLNSESGFCLPNKLCCLSCWIWFWFECFLNLETTFFHTSIMTIALGYFFHLILASIIWLFLKKNLNISLLFFFFGINSESHFWTLFGHLGLYICSFVF